MMPVFERNGRTVATVLRLDELYDFVAKADFGMPVWLEFRGGARAPLNAFAGSFPEAKRFYLQYDGSGFNCQKPVQSVFDQCRALKARTVDSGRRPCWISAIEEGYDPQAVIRVFVEDGQLILSSACYLQEAKIVVHPTDHYPHGDIADGATNWEGDDDVIDEAPVDPFTEDPREAPIYRPGE